MMRFLKVCHDYIFPNIPYLIFHQYHAGGYDAVWVKKKPTREIPGWLLFI